jgi:hypothetical protein
MKRHEKPYGCTFEGCTKRFGSKNDWKRHENSQHFLLEVWKCDVKDGQEQTEVCGKVNHRRETFRQHLSHNHRLTPETIEKKLEECRVGRNCEANFWCGFCVGIIKNKGKGVDAWAERYNHIDDHIGGRNNLPQKLMDEWKGVDPEAQPLSSDSFHDSENSEDFTSSMSLVHDGPLADETAREAHRITVNKRKSDSLSDSRHSKRSKSGGLVTARCVSMHSHFRLP